MNNSAVLWCCSMVYHLAHHLSLSLAISRRGQFSPYPAPLCSAHNTCDTTHIPSTLPRNAIPLSASIPVQYSPQRTTATGRDGTRISQRAHTPSTRHVALRKSRFKRAAASASPEDEPNTRGGRYRGKKHGMTYQRGKDKLAKCNTMQESHSASASVPQ
jgi:hypothetical protein